MSEQTIKLIEAHGFPWVMALLFMGVMFMIFRKFLENITNNQDIPKALDEVRESNKNVAKSLEILNKSMEMDRKVTELMFDDVKEVQQRLYLHDDRSEKILTRIVVQEKAIEQILAKEIGRAEAHEAMKQIKQTINNYTDKELREGTKVSS